MSDDVTDMRAEILELERFLAQQRTMTDYWRDRALKAENDARNG